MTSNILEQVTQSESAERGQLLTEYRELLLLPDPKPADADRLREVARELGFDLARLAVDQQAVAKFARLSDQAADVTDAGHALNQSNATATKHRETMTKKLAELQAKQVELDTAESVALARTGRADNARRGLRELRENHPELFEGVPDVDAMAERAALEAQATTLPELREQLAQAQADLESAETELDDADAACHRIPTNHADKEAAIQTKTEARTRRDGLAEKIASLHMAIHEARLAGEALEEV